MTHLRVMSMQGLKSRIAYVGIGAHSEHMPVLLPDPRHLKRKMKLSGFVSL